MLLLPVLDRFLWLGCDVMAIEIDGIEKLIERLDSLASTENMERAVGRACALVEGDARRKAPKDSGDLRRFMDSKVTVSGDDIVGTVFNPLEYAPYAEFGTGLFAENGGRKDVPWCYKDEDTGELIFTRGQKPQPFLRPALNENREGIKRILKGGLSSD